MLEQRNRLAVVHYILEHLDNPAYYSYCNCFYYYNFYCSYCCDRLAERCNLVAEHCSPGKVGSLELVEGCSPGRLLEAAVHKLDMLGSLEEHLVGRCSLDSPVGCSTGCTGHIGYTDCNLGLALGLDFVGLTCLLVDAIDRYLVPI